RLHMKLGDYIVAYSLSGGQAVLPVQSLSGIWRGDIIPSGRERFPVELQLGDDLRGEIRGPLTGTFTGTRSGNTINYHVDFSFPEHSCKGTWVGKLEIANDGKLLVGESTIDDECAGRTPLHVVKPAVLSLRR
ncbi:MAG TPA: hypothetical protein VJ853_01360, partial [Thermoanaerobaculia bacterium]|nr:hypothetical protein [Thermoanaerobaculia bacterium]